MTERERKVPHHSIWRTIYNVEENLKKEVFSTGKQDSD